jgi:hypothetical protein
VDLEGQGCSRAETDRFDEGNSIMALSDQLTALAARAKELEDRAAAAKSKTKSELKQEVKDARAASQAQTEKLRTSADAGKAHVSDWWDGVRQSWNKHLKSVQENFEDKKAERDLKAAERAADHADDDAAFAIDYAYAAIEEAEYAVLDAELAHMDRDELANA